MNGLTPVDSILLEPIRPFRRTSLEDVAGCLAYSGQPKTIEEMDAAIEQAVSEEWHDYRLPGKGA